MFDMNMYFMQLLNAGAWLCSLFFTVYAAYYTITGLMAAVKRRQRRSVPPENRFAIVIAARNEEAVIGGLVESLRQQDYPDELYDIIVAPNNCTDNTATAARKAGAGIFRCTGRITGKGQVLTQVFDSLLAQQRYDAFCVFDADNLVHPGFLRAMNDALASGSSLAQGYRDSKNPYDTAISGCYSIYYWMINRFYNHARAAVGLSAIINGSGFMVSAPLLEKIGGWHTYTMTEDIEFTTQCVLAGERVSWVPDAIIYDEQPLTFTQSWNQRKRWSTGLLQCFQMYFPPLVHQLCKKRSWQSFDQIMFLIAPVMQLVYLLSLCLGLTANLFYAQLNFFPYTDLYFQLFISAGGSIVLSAGLAMAAMVLEHKFSYRMLKGMFSYWFFILSWIPINILVIFRKSTVWEEVKHTRAISYSQLKSGLGLQ